MRWLALILSMYAGSAGAAELDLGAPEGADRTAYVVRESDSYALPMGAVEPSGASLRQLDGRAVWSTYRMQTAEGAQDVLAGYKARLADLGFEPAFECWTAACGGFDFRFGVTVLPAPFMRMDVQAFGQFSARRETPEAYASVLVSAVQGIIYVQTVALTPAATPAKVAAAPASRAEQVSGDELKPGDTRALGDRLRVNGHVAIEGLAFAPGGTQLSGNSADTLDALARLLTRDAELEVVIVGHSDNEGSLDANIELSRRRAEAVRAALVSRGVPRKQLEARGVGYLAPVTSNESEEGRQSNRRVELVVK